MRVSVLQENLAKALSTVSRAVSSRPTQSVLGNILLTTEDGKLRLSAINLDQGISITDRIGANVETEGAITVPAKEFVEIVNLLPPGTVDLELDTRTLLLVIRSGGRASNKLKGIEADQFPALPEPESEDAMTLPAEAFQDMIGQVVFAAAKEDNRPILMGIQTRLDSEKISMVAADGFRMSLRTSLLSDGSVRPVTLVIPAKTLVELARIDPGETNEVHIAVAQSRSQVIFNVGTVDIVSQLIDGKFPDVEHLIPKAAATTTIVNTKDLMVACKNAEIVARNVNNTTRLSIKPNRNAGEFGAVVVSAEASERGANEWTIEGTIDGPGLEIAFNVRYMIEVLSVIKEDQVVLETNGANQPGVVKPIGRQDFVYVIMPMSTR